MDAGKALGDRLRGAARDDFVSQLVFPRRIIAGIEISHDEPPGLRIVGHELRNRIGADIFGEFQPTPFEGIARNRRFPKLRHFQSRQRALEAITLATNHHLPDVRRHAPRQRLANAGLPFLGEIYAPHHRADQLRSERAIGAIGSNHGKFRTLV